MPDDHRATIDEEPGEAGVELAAVDDRAYVPVRYVKLAIAAAAIVVIAVVGSSDLSPSPGVPGGSSASTGPAPTPSRSASPAGTTRRGTGYAAIDAGTFDVPWSGGRIRLTMPPGWSSAVAGWPGCSFSGRPCTSPQGGTTVTRYGLDDVGPLVTLDLVHDVSYVVNDVCGSPPDLTSVAVGPTVEDLVTALETLAGIPRSGPLDLTVDGYPAKRFVLAQAEEGGGSCRPPQRHPIWTNATSYPFDVPGSETSTVYIVDVTGTRLVITSRVRGASADDVAQLEAIIASIEIEPAPAPGPDASPAPIDVFPAQGQLASGRHALAVAGVPVSFEVPERGGGTTDWASNGAFYISKDTKFPQSAEAAILWTAFPDDDLPVACVEELGRLVHPSADELAAAVALAPADPLTLSGPSDVTVGGRAAKRVTFTVGDDHGCQPGFFYTWLGLYGGSLWNDIGRGDTISVWIVEVDGVLVFIEGMTTTRAAPQLLQELQQLIDSIRFE